MEEQRKEEVESSAGTSHTLIQMWTFAEIGRHLTGFNTLPVRHFLVTRPLSEDEAKALADAHAYVSGKLTLNTQAVQQLTNQLRFLEQYQLKNLNESDEARRATNVDWFLL
jgi:hypothetical protein